MRKGTPVIDEQRLVERLNRILRPREGKERGAPEKMGGGAAGLDLQRVIERIDCIRKFLQFLVGSRLVVECAGVVRVLSKRPVEITDGIAETAKVVQGKAFPQPGIIVFRLQLQGLVKGKDRIAVLF